MNQRIFTVAIGLAILVLIAWIYWPMRQGILVWDDILCLREQAWLRQENAWNNFLGHDFCRWTNYFRPGAVALFLFEARTFDVFPGPMHMVSLGIHLANTLLVGLLAITLWAWRDVSGDLRLLVYISMLLYGLHPALIEPVAWISSQTELIVTFFMLLGLWLNTTLRQSLARAFSVSTCFFMAACAKESAIAFPLVLVLVDWMSMPNPIDHATEVRNLWRHQWRTYLGILAAGLAYLALRNWALGYLLAPTAGSVLSPLARLQEICYSYLVYWRMLIWPMMELGPVHVIDEGQFAILSAKSVTVDLTAILIASYGVFGLCKRRPFGGAIALVTALLLPVLHIVPVAFDESLYHDRYAMTAVAFGAAMLPGICVDVVRGWHARAQYVGIAVALVAWLSLSIVNIRVTLPLWSNDIGLWHWALHSNPGSVSAKENLLASYITHEDPRAYEFANGLIADATPCSSCLLNIAYFAMSKHHTELASAALMRLKDSGNLAYDARLLQAFNLANALLLEQKGNITSAEQVYRDVITADPQEPLAQTLLALLLARQGKVAEARSIEESALLLFAPDERARRRREFEEALASSAATTR